jgi:hypothetical protein
MNNIPQDNFAQETLAPGILAKHALLLRVFAVAQIDRAVLGQSAAMAAIQAVNADTVVQDLTCVDLKKRLLADGQILVWKE